MGSNKLWYVFLVISVFFFVFSMSFMIKSMVDRNLEVVLVRELTGDIIIESCDRNNVCLYYDTKEVTIYSKGDGLIVRKRYWVEFEVDEEKIVINLKNVKIMIGE